MASPFTDKRYSVQRIHDGTDWAIIDATPDDMARNDGFAMTLNVARKLAQECATRDQCRWFDMTTYVPPATHYRSIMGSREEFRQSSVYEDRYSHRFVRPDGTVTPWEVWGACLPTDVYPVVDCT